MRSDEEDIVRITGKERIIINFQEQTPFPKLVNRALYVKETKTTGGRRQRYLLLV